MPQLTALLPRLPLSLPAGAARQALFGACAVLLAAILGFLYLKTQGADIKRQNEVLALLRELKEIDSRWDVETLRSRNEFQPPPPAFPDYGATLARVRRELAAASEALDSPVLRRGLPDLGTAIVRKAEMVAQYKKASADSKAALAQVLDTDGEIAALVRGSWQDFRERERLVAAENTAVHLIAESQRYYFAPTEVQRRVVETVAADLRKAGARLPVPLREGLMRLDGRVGALLAAKAAEDGLYQKLIFITAGPRIASLTGGLSRELEAALADQEFYRAYLVAYSGALLILLGYLATRLAASYRLLNAANAALKSANEGLEQRVAERTRELSEALKQLKQSEAQLIQSEKMSSLGQMVAGVVHEINTPLAYVKNSLGSVTGRLPDLARLVVEVDKLLELLRAGAANPEDLAQQFGVTERLVAQFRQRHLIEEMQTLVKDGLHGIGQMTELVVNLRNFSRLDRSKVASCNLNDGLESTLLLARHELKDRTVKKNFGDIPSITCSPSQVNQVFLNLINNAAQATEPGKGVIVITTRREDEGHVAVEVEDNGQGIPPEILPKIFDPFFTTKDVGKGTGLGLSIAYKIVEQHGGRIRVGSTVGVGTRFSVVLPLTPPEAAAGAA